MEPRYPDIPDDGIFTISNSTANTASRCVAKHFLDQELRHRATTVALAIGTAIAKATEHDCTAKLQDREAPLREIIDLAVASYDAEVGAAEQIPETKHEQAAGRDSTAAAAIAYGREVSSELGGVIETEPRGWSVLLEWDEHEPIRYVGRPDVVCRHRTPQGVVYAGVDDVKTGRKWTQQRADDVGQLTGYDMLFEARYPQQRDRAHWIRSIHPSHRKGEWTSTHLFTRREPEQRARYIERLRILRDGIQAGIPLPAWEGDPLCAREYCVHWDTCPVRSGR